MPGCRGHSARRRSRRKLGIFPCVGPNRGSCSCSVRRSLFSRPPLIYVPLSFIYLSIYRYRFQTQFIRQQLCHTIFTEIISICSLVYVNETICQGPEQHERHGIFLQIRQYKGNKAFTHIVLARETHFCIQCRVNQQ